MASVCPETAGGMAAGRLPPPEESGAVAVDVCLFRKNRPVWQLGVRRLRKNRALWQWASAPSGRFARCGSAIPARLTRLGLFPSKRRPWGLSATKVGRRGSGPNIRLPHLPFSPYAGSSPLPQLGIFHVSAARAIVPRPFSSQLGRCGSGSPAASGKIARRGSWVPVASGRIGRYGSWAPAASGRIARCGSGPSVASGRIGRCGSGRLPLPEESAGVAAGRLPLPEESRGVAAPSPPA